MEKLPYIVAFVILVVSCFVGFIGGCVGSFFGLSFGLAATYCFVGSFAFLAGGVFFGR